MWLIFGIEIPHHLGAWATKFQISNASFNKFITEGSIKHKNQLSETCINHRILEDPHVSIIGKHTFNNHNADALANKILMKILATFIQSFKRIDSTGKIVPDKLKQ